VTSVAAVYLGLLVLAPLFAVVERRRPAAHLARTRRALAIDLAYWVITPLLTGTFARALVLGVIVALGAALGFGCDGPAFLSSVEARMPLARLPAPASFAVALVLADGLAYLSHRLRHGRVLWRLHAVHHGAEELTALAAARLHPLDETLDTVLISVPVLLLGVPLSVFAALAPVFLLHTLLVHANVDWSFGPLGRVLASPRFHRRHHARDLPPANYGGVLAVFDVLFGTFEMPAADPGVYGVAERDVPESVLGQMLYPIRRLFGPASS
jgi:sterol desaturase/sphingolipid hydroxylase (fatty acid hydroxylase superfamily)